MKCIFPDSTRYVMGETEQSDYESGNVLDHYTRHLWKATTSEAWLRVHCSSNSVAIGLAGLNAILVTFRLMRTVAGGSSMRVKNCLYDEAAHFIFDGVAEGDFVWNCATNQHVTVLGIVNKNQLMLSDDIFLSEYGGEYYVIETGEVDSYTYDMGSITTYADLITDRRGDDAYKLAVGYSLGWQYSAQLGVHNVKIDLAAGGPAQCGIVRSGPLMAFPTPEYGLKEGLKDFSIIKSLNNGADYTRKRDVVRTFSGSMTVKRNPVYAQYINSLHQLNGPLPLFWWLTDLEDGHEWTTFARYESAPGGSHDYPTHSTISFSLIEVI